ncbi:MAG: hypothetical protein CM1200mP16_09730 [Nitrospina sp.]|nr:MAG: hypothetical protein CM1200mP16_09730 [Nitrospina sp.]
MVKKTHPTDKEYAESFRPELLHMFSEIKNFTLWQTQELRAVDVCRNQFWRD